MDMDAAYIATLLLEIHAAVLLIVACLPAMAWRHRTIPLAHATPIMVIYIFAMAALAVTLFLHWSSYKAAGCNGALPLGIDAFAQIGYSFMVIASVGSTLMSMKTISRLRDWSDRFYE